MDKIELSKNAQHIAEVLPGSQNNVNQVMETVNRISAQRSFEVNANVLRIQDKMTRSFLDIVA